MVQLKNPGYKTRQILWQTSHSNIESRRRQWLGNQGVKGPTRIVCKDNAQLPIEIVEDIRIRHDGLTRGNDRSATIRSAESFRQKRLSQ
jgi:hypothetical protein